MRLPTLKEVYQNLLEVKLSDSRKCLKYAHNDREVRKILKGELDCDGACVERYDKVNSIIEIKSKALKKRGCPPEKFKGMGAAGVALSIKGSPDKVLKITVCEHEAVLANVLMDKDLDHVAKIYDVFSLGEGHYGIVQESLKMLDKKKDSAFIDVIDNKEIINSLQSYIKDGSKYEETRNFVLNASNAFGTYFSPKDREQVQKAATQLLKAVESVREYATPDLSSTNTMKKGGNYYLIDMHVKRDVHSMDEIIAKLDKL